MHSNIFLLFCLVQAIFALTPGAALFKRQTSGTCPSGYSQCGANDCYKPQSEVCCASASVHCDVGEYCSVDSNGNTGCCPVGKVCSGNVVATLTQAITGTTTTTTRIPSSSSIILTSRSTTAVVVVTSSSSHATTTTTPTTQPGTSAPNVSSQLTLTTFPSAKASQPNPAAQLTLTSSVSSSSSSRTSTRSTSSSSTTSAPAATTTIIQSASGAVVGAPLFAIGGIAIAQFLL